MPTWTHIKIPETPSPNYVVVRNISPESSEKAVKEFFLFCGQIKEFELTKDDDGVQQAALINFERDNAAKTAVLLSNALIDDSHITVNPYFEMSPAEEGEKKEETEQHERQETKPKSRIAAEILASGYILQDNIVAKGLEYDHKYNLSSRLTGYLTTLQTNVKSFDDKYRIWDKALNFDNKYKIQEKVQNAAQTAQTKAQAALQTPTGQKVHEIANQTLAQIAAVHYEAKKIQASPFSEKLGASLNQQPPASGVENIKPTA
ncbi:uncharacterized protein BYT42DRAFT_611642 [Radiomyces spectabilis]|uniref:uncharacterized protein n=1 Tax=Radiomyces spectabilis TaxID=64574 RepID=UPI00221E742E|nr:uncharacterized protein BYT42DRAFT_611642 [Radiomyces spectabilis]KAI8388621.1 hypothetical protein BYT42DRAFT_611642 [Radiomyces spectabilis]